MPKKFNGFDADKTMNMEYGKRTYHVRQFVNKESMMNEGFGDANDMETRDYSFEASSYPEAMGLLIGDMVQNYAFNMCVKMFQQFVEFFENAYKILDDEAVNVNDIANKMGLQLDIEDDDELESIKETAKNNWQNVRIPVGFALEILSKNLEQMKHFDNLAFWQEPELIIMGNPNLVENMHVQAETIDDVAKNAVKDMEKFLINFASKSEEE